MANGGIETEQATQRDRRKYFVEEGQVTLLDEGSERQLDCIDLRLFGGWEKQRDTWQHWVRRAYCTWLMG